MGTRTLSERVERYGWYHTLDLGGGVVTRGMFDHRRVVHRYLLPADLSGLRCLDVGTMDGFWAFEMERQGATDVVALDLEQAERLDWPAAIRTRVVKTLDETKGERFDLARAALGSRVERVTRSVYDLDERDLGTFDLVFCGDVLVHLKDPITAVERLRAVCRASAIVANPIERFRFAGRRPMARLDGIDDFRWWITNLEGLVRLVRAGGFERLERATTFELPPVGGGPWKGLRGVVRAGVQGGQGTPRKEAG